MLCSPLEYRIGACIRQSPCPSNMEQTCRCVERNETFLQIRKDESNCIDKRRDCIGTRSHLTANAKDDHLETRDQKIQRIH